MKTLIIGQLPKEIGGNYTTGAANVVYELSKKNIDNLNYSTFGTNLPSRTAVKYSNYKNQYIGYEICVARILIDVFKNPRRTYREWKHYRKVDHLNPLRLAFYKANIKRAIIITQPDIIHVHSVGNISATRFAINNLKNKKIPILLTCHGIFYRGDSNDLITKDRYLGNIHFADYYSGLTKQSKEEYENYLEIPKKDVSIIPNGVDTSKFYYSDMHREIIRNELGANQSTIVFITVGSVQERKGQLRFIEFLNDLDIDFQYWIIGAGDDENAIKDYCKTNNMLDKVKILGFCESTELFKYYSAADIYAHVSTKEGQALSELEANATGLRCIVSKDIIGTIANELAPSFYYVLDFNNQNKSTLKEWILSKAPIRKSNPTFDWQVIASQYLDLYKKIVSNHLK